MAGFLFLLSVVVACGTLMTVLYCLHLLWCDRLPDEWIVRTQHLVRWLIVSGSGVNLGAAVMSYALANEYAQRLAAEEKVPVEAIMIDHEAQSAAGALKPGELVITRKPDGTMTTSYIATTPRVTDWESR